MEWIIQNKSNELTKSEKEALLSKKIERYLENLNEKGLIQALRFVLNDTGVSNKGFILQCVEDNARMYPSLRDIPLDRVGK